jgi:hypothetical protein
MLILVFWQMLASLGEGITFRDAKNDCLLPNFNDSLCYCFREISIHSFPLPIWWIIALPIANNQVIRTSIEFIFNKLAIYMGRVVISAEILLVNSYSFKGILLNI